MTLVRTPLRLKENLKKKVEKEAEKIIFKIHDLGRPIDNLKRAEFYPKPE